MLSTVLSPLSYLGLIAPVAAVPPAMSQYIYEDLMTWVSDARILAAVRQRNKQAAFRRRAAQCRVPETAACPLNGPLSGFLRAQRAASGGRIRGVCVVDARGMAVAASGMTAALWASATPLFQKAFAKGAGAVLVDKCAFNETSQSYHGQVSFSLADPASGAAVGTISFGLDTAAFASRGRHL